MEKHYKLEGLGKGVLIAGLVFAMGFGVMNIFWLSYTGTRNWPGLYDYKAAAIGDSIFLPLLLGSITVYVSLNKKLTTKQWRFSKKIGLVSGLAAIIIQYSWLCDDNITLNWTIPRIHYFTVAGYYHAASLFYRLSHKCIVYNEVMCIVSGVSGSLGIGLAVNGTINWRILFAGIAGLFSTAFVVQRSEKLNEMFNYIFLVSIRVV